MSERLDLTEAPIPAARRAAHKPGKGGRGGSGMQKLEDAARTVFFLAGALSVLLLLYLLWGLWSGAWSHHAMVALSQARRDEQLANINLVFELLQGTSLVSVISLLVFSARSEGVGYWLVGTAGFLYAGTGFVTAQVFAFQHLKPSMASITASGHLQWLAWLFGIPGVVCTAVDLVRRFGSAAEMAAINRANVKYGAAAGKEAAGNKRGRQVFLGRCWEGPYCKDNIRVKCPVYLKKRGPCWWYKEGCMCEPRIVLQAMISSDWKEKSAEARKSLESGGPRPILTPEAKRERCRNCIIYNEHQRQKHKALSAIVLLSVPAFLALNFAAVQQSVGHLLETLDNMTRRFQFGETPEGIAALHNGGYNAMAWVFILTISVVVLSQALKVIEYFCFKLKV